MLAEGIHSLADTGDQLLMVLGIKRSHKPPDENHPFGTSKDPTIFIVLAEDTAGLLGIAVAGIGISLELFMQSPFPDAIAAILIGVILAIVALLMGYETKALLLGESADIEVVEEIRRIVKNEPLVKGAHPATRSCNRSNASRAKFASDFPMSGTSSSKRNRFENTGPHGALREIQYSRLLALTRRFS
jgi:divalent metal cation (Fe/Co/Zn/Cd) transporter